jgi:hypothetical protein
MSHIQTYTGESIFSDYVSKQTTDFNDAFSEETAFPLTEAELQERPKVYGEIEEAMSNLQSNLSRPVQDQDWINHFTSYIRQIMGAKRAQSPREQFNYLYHLRKLLFWAPVSMLTARNGDIQSLLVLSHFYAVALRLDMTFPDIGAAYLGNLVLIPLEEVLNVLQIYQADSRYRSLSHTIAALLVFPQNAASEYRARRQWLSRQSGIQTSIHQPYELTTISSELGHQFGTQYSYTPSLSPAFASPSPHLVSPPLNIAQTPRSPFLQVPGSAVDSYSYNSYSSPLTSYHTAPTSTYDTSPLLSPGYKSVSDDAYQITQSDYTPTILSTPISVSESGLLGSSQYGSYGVTSGTTTNAIGGYAGGVADFTRECVGPTAIWT